MARCLLMYAGVKMFRQILVTFIAILAVTTPALADECDDATVISINYADFLAPETDVPAAIQDALTEAGTYVLSTTPHKIRFEVIGSLLADGSVSVPAPLTLIPSGYDSGRPIVICGLNVTKGPSYTSSEPILKINNRKKVSLYDTHITGASKGILMQGSIPGSGVSHEIHGGEIACGDQTGYGVRVESSRAKLDGVTIHGCGDGVYDSAHNVVGENLTIYGNKLGWHVAGGKIGHQVLKSKICGNDDGVATQHERFDGIRLEATTVNGEAVDPARSAGFYVKQDDVVEAVDASSLEVVEFDADAGEAPYFTPPPMPSIYNASSGSLKVNVYYSEDEGGCGPSGSLRPLSQVSNNAIDTTSMQRNDITSDGVPISLPPEAMNKNLILTFTDSVGTTAYSKKVKLLGGASVGGQVLIGSGPEAITLSTPSGADGGAGIGGIDVGGAAAGAVGGEGGAVAVDDAALAAMQGTGTEAIEGAVDGIEVTNYEMYAEGGAFDTGLNSNNDATAAARTQTQDTPLFVGASGGNSAGVSGGCTIVAADSSRNMVDLWSGLWWVITAAILIAFLRMLPYPKRARVRHPTAVNCKRSKRT